MTRSLNAEREQLRVVAWCRLIVFNWDCAQKWVVLRDCWLVAKKRRGGVGGAGRGDRFCLLGLSVVS